MTCLWFQRIWCARKVKFCSHNSNLVSSSSLFRARSSAFRALFVVTISLSVCVHLEFRWQFNMVKISQDYFQAILIEHFLFFSHVEFPSPGDFTWNFFFLNFAKIG